MDSSLLPFLGQGTPDLDITIFSIMTACLVKPATSHPTTIHTLPVELMDEIVNHLPPSSVRSFANAYKRLYYLVSPPPLYDLERFKFLCMLDRDQKVSRPVCSGCMTTHDKSYFRPTQLREQPEHRKCLETQKLLWISPYQTLSFVEVKRLTAYAKPLYRAPSQYVYHKWPACDPLWIRTKDDSYALTTFYLLTKVFEPVPPPLDEVRNILRDYDLPICPHLRLSDPAILNVYNSDCVYDSTDPSKCCVS